MTGPEHYREAERLQEAIDDFDATDPAQQPLITQILAEAQVHATLALAAATALCQADNRGHLSPDVWQAWSAAAGSEQK